MFYILHRIYVVSWVVLVVGALVWLYPRAGLSEPLLDWYAVWQNGGAPGGKPVAELSGTVDHVFNGVSFTMRGPDRQLYTIGLAGVVLPPSGQKPAPVERDRSEQTKDLLSSMILSNEVRVVATWLDPLRRGVGVVYLGSTNVNAAMVESGLVRVKREYMKSLSWRDQVALLRAERTAAARQAQTGGE